MKVIKVKYYEPTDTKGSKYTASIKDNQGIIFKFSEDFNFSFSNDEQPKKMAEELCKKYFNGTVKVNGGGVYGEDYYFTIN